MEDQLITFDTAYLAKEKGFDIKTKSMYGSQNIPQIEDYNEVRFGIYRDYYFAPTQSLLQRWLREVHTLVCVCLPLEIEDVIKYESLIFGHNLETEDFSDNNVFDTYELALEDSLLSALKLIDNGTN